MCVHVCTCVRVLMSIMCGCVGDSFVGVYVRSKYVCVCACVRVYVCESAWVYNHQRKFRVYNKDFFVDDCCRFSLN